jgi:hypothetical protein
LKTCLWEDLSCFGRERETWTRVTALLIRKGIEVKAIY